MRSVRRNQVAVATLVALLVGQGLLGCQAGPEDPAPEVAIVAATGVPDMVEFRTDGGPIDTGEQPTELLTESDAIARALASSAELQASLARVQIALADSRQARLVANPLLSVAIRYPSGGGPAVIEPSLAEDLLGFISRPHVASAADHRLNEAAAEAVATAVDVVTRLEESYAAVQALDAIVPLLGERRQLLERLRSVAQSRLDLGEGTRLDVTSLDAQAVELELEIAERSADQRAARLALTRLIGQPSGPADWTLETWSALPSIQQTEATWTSTALEKRPDLLALQWELAALDEDASAAGLSLWENSSAGIDAERDGEWAVGPQVELPLPIIDTGSARKERARAAIAEARHRLTEAQRVAIEDVRSAYAAFQAAAANLGRVRDELVPALEKRRLEVEEIYLAGQTDITTLMLAEQDLRAAQVKHVELEEAARGSLARLRRAVGGGGVVAGMEPELGPSGSNEEP